MNAAPKLEDVQERAKRLSEWADRPSRTRMKTITDSAMARATREVEAMLESGEWDDALPRHFLALYALLHLRVYKVEALELTSSVRLFAAGAAGKMLKAHFDDDPYAFVEFIRWTWQREARREVWRRDNGRDGQRIGWRLQFGGSLLTDYKRSLQLARGG
jgi:hypothetical protein